MNETESILASSPVTQRNSVFIGHAFVWLLEESDDDGWPRLHWSSAGQGAVFVDARWAFPVERLFSSEFQARLWCAYHGFAFVQSALAPRPVDFLRHRVAAATRRLRPCAEFRVERYETHRERCPDCTRRARQGVEWVAQRDAWEGVR